MSQPSELEKKYIELLKNQDVFMMKSIDNVNHKPHPYTIGPRHVAHAADHHSGILGQATVEAVKCAHPKCDLPHDQHTSDKVIFLSIKRNASEKEANDILQPLGKKMETDKIDGLTFVETPEKFRIT